MPASLAGVRSRASIVRRAILAAALLSSAAHADPVLPTGGQFVAGQGAIVGSANGLTINQSGSHGIINWQNFSIGAGGKVQFNNGNGATLNRVTGADISQINGQLRATGSLYVINPQGIVIGPGGKVVTGGSFVASTRDISNSDFLGGGAMSASGSSNGDVVNAGTITSRNGDAILVGRSVSNSGKVTARKGAAVMAAGNEILLRPATGDARIAVSGGTGDVTNTGAIAAAQAQLTAAGGNVYALAGNNGGLVSATGTATINGRVWLTAGGTTSVSGTVSAKNADGSGGAVTARGADIEVSGAIDTSATQAGKAGGDVSVIALGTTVFSGRIDAKGGAGGKGGFVDTSGGQVQIKDSARVSTLAANGVSGTWLIDPPDYIVAASGGDITGATVSTNLATTNVAIASANGTVNPNGNGDIFINDPISWSTSNTLTLTAVGQVYVNSPINITGAGGLTVTAAGLSFGLGPSGFAGRVNYGATDNGGTLNIGGAAYTLLYNNAAVQNINASNAALGGTYALATSLDATGVSWTPIGTNGAGAVSNSSAGFTGTFEGLGNTISNLTISLSGVNNVGLFGYTSGSGSLRNIGLVNAAVTGGQNIGALAGQANAAIVNAYVSGAVTGTATGTTTLGGLIGQMGGGGISGSFAAVTVSSTGDKAGGLAGELSAGTISNSYATGSVSFASGNPAGTLGGLVGALSGSGSIANSHATGAVTANTNPSGGLVGNLSTTGSITNSYATGTVTGTAFVGGLVGNQSAGNILDSYATGDVVASAQRTGGLVGRSIAGNITRSYATGAVSSASGNNYVGGLVGNKESGTISDSFATGSVTAPSAATSGGLVGNLSGTASVTTSFATGYVSALSGAGGLVGSKTGTGTVTDSYWNTQTTGLSVSGGGGTGQTTAQLQAALPTGFSASTWGNVAGASYPYLKSFYATAPQVVSGIAYSDLGVTAAQGVTVSALLDGATLSNALAGTVRTGANGYYYMLLPAGTIGSNKQVLAYTTGGTGGVAFQHNASGSISSLDIWGAGLRQTSAATTLSAITAALSTAVGSSGVSTSFNNLAVVSTGGSLAIDTAISKSGLVSLTAAGAVTQSAAIGSGSLQLLGGSASYTLTNSSNSVGTVAASTGGVSLTNGAALSVGTVSGTVGITSSGNVTLTGSSTIAIDNAIAATSGRLTVNATGGGAVSAAGAVNVNAFTLQNGAWSQNTASLPGFAAADFTISGGSFLRVTGGDGSSGTPYQIADLFGLQGIGSSATLLGKSYLLTADINASGTSSWNSGAGFAPIGSSTAFSGSFNGQNHVVSGLTINRSSTDSVGLFGNSSGTIQQVGLTGGSITGRNRTGALVGNNSATVTKSYATASVTGAQQVGGLVGQSTNTISLSYATGTVSGTLYVGGLAGYSNFQVVSSYATGAVSGTDYVGGLLGKFGGTVNKSYATGAVTGTGTNVGGLGGQTDGVTFVQSFWNTETSGQSVGVGAGYSGSQATGLTTAQMKNLSTFSAAGWDIDDAGGTGNVWRIYDGNTAPLLRNFLTSLTATYTNADKTYDAAVYNSFGTPALSVPGATLSGSATVVGSAASAKNAGSHAIIGSYYSNQAGYDISYAGTLTITKATLAALTGSRSYDAGTVFAAVTFGTAGTLTTGIGTETLVLSGSGSVASANAGAAQGLTLGTLALGNGSNGGLAANYQFGTGNTGTISKATLAALSGSRTYDASTAFAAATFSHGFLLTPPFNALKDKSVLKSRLKTSRIRW